jgi:hypothetical protein
MDLEFSLKVANIHVILSVKYQIQSLQVELKQICELF